MNRGLIIPDIHTRDQNDEAIKPIFQFAKYYKPTFCVQLGDLCNFDSISKYDPRNIECTKITLDEEIASANQILDRIEEALPKKCEKYITGGNHEARYPAYKVKHGFKTEIAMLHHFTSWQEEYKLQKRGWKSCEYGQWFELGRIIYTHGWYSGGNHAKRHLHLFHKNIMYAHTHEWQVATGTGIDGLPIMSASIGTLSNQNLSYLVGKPPVNWVNMFAWVDEGDNGNFTPHFTTIIEGKFIEMGREFCGN